MKAVGLTNIGKVRLNNEDALYHPKCAEDVQNVFIVADGMGGHNAGEVASNLAIAEAIGVLRRLEHNEQLTMPEKVYQAIAEANFKVYSEMQANTEYRGMGTTFTMAMTDGNRAAIGHVGDSRAYHFSGGALEQVTIDHSLVQELIQAGRISVQEARAHPMRNVITRSLGTMRFVDIDVFTLTVKKDEMLLLCSDGLSNFVGDEEIAKILRGGADLRKKAETLIQRALHYGGGDNITALIVLFDEGGDEL